jgi:FG-GAP-like repeat
LEEFMLRRGLAVTGFLFSLLFVVAPDLRAQEIRLFQPDSIPAGFESAKLAATFSSSSAEWYLGDFNGDGILDLVATPGGDLTLQLGNGDGTFGSAVIAATQVGSVAAVGDFNNDGHLDVVVLDGTPSLKIYLGDGSGSFSGATPAALSAYAGDVAMADFNGDGLLDVVVTYGYWSQRFSILLGNGDGSFQPPLDRDLTDSVTQPVAGDFNADGKADLALVSSGGTSIDVLLGNGDGTFALPATVFAGASPTNLRAADLDGDGHLDLIAIVNNGNNPSWSISVLLGYGDGSFQAVRAIGSSFAYVLALSVGDIDGDGKPDLGIVGSDYNSPSKFLTLHGNGDGTFIAAASYVFGPQLGQVVLSDLDGDGFLDAVAGGYYGNAIWSMLGRPAGRFHGVEDLRVSQPVFGDFDGDGTTDVVNFDLDPSGQAGTLRFRHGNGDGTFSTATSMPVSSNIALRGVGDFNGDGNPDLLTSNQQSFISETDAVIYFGAGDGTFRASAPFRVGNYYGPFFGPVGDFNGDGLSDFVVFDYDYSTNQNLVTTWAGVGDGTFLAGASPSSFTPSSVAAGDFDGDGLLDLVAAADYYPTSEIVLYRNIGGGSFGAPTSVGSVTRYPSITAGDVDGDGRLDLLVGDGGANLFSIYRGHGDLTFDPPLNFGLPNQPAGVGIGDLDGDGHEDIMISTTDSHVLVSFGTGGGGFQAPYAFSVGGNPGVVRALTINPVRLPDIAVVNGDGTTSLVMNSRSRTPNPPSKLFTTKPCRIVDTRRAPAAPTGLSANTTRFLSITDGPCAIPPDASAIVANVTAVRPSDNGDFRLFPAGTALPTSSTINFAAGRSRANNAIVPLGGIDEKGISVRCDMPAGFADFVLDVSGYFR